jgi:cytochrome c-type biogenesis protein CcmH
MDTDPTRWRRIFGRLSGVLLVLVVVAGLGWAAHRTPAPLTPAQRSAQLANEVRCPSCLGLSAEESSAATAQAIRIFIAKEVGAGRSDRAIRQALIARYGQGITMSPPASGLSLLVWALPVAMALLAAVAIGVIFWRRSRRPPPLTPEQRLRLDARVAQLAGNDERG